MADDAMMRALGGVMSAEPERKPMAKRVIEMARATGIPGSAAYTFLLLSADLTDEERRHAQLCQRLIAGVELEMQIIRPGDIVRISGVG